MFAGAAFLGFSEALIPGGPYAPLAPAVIALVIAPLLALFGKGLGRRGLAPLGPIAAVLIAATLAQSHVAGDGAVLYMWPVVWVSHFYGRRATVAMIVWVGIVHALALAEMPAGLGNVDRWMDVVVCVALVAGTIRWLTERHERLMGRVHAEARVDVLTGLANRRGFDEAFPRLVERAQLEGRPIAVVSVDIDHFKAVNDTHGHDVGDRVLISVGQTLRERARVLDLVGRVGGEEFVVVLPGLDGQAAHRVAERIRLAISRSGAGRHPAITVSAGVAALEPGATATAEKLLATADAALYDAKRAGRDCTLVRSVYGVAASSAA
ncbi:MAG: hypothetical protein QOI80_712 [Solirubrobacteraceae bacterium]|nr:hypothetical protein [Solirubrobacteraceae bacterium]